MQQILETLQSHETKPWVSPQPLLAAAHCSGRSTCWRHLPPVGEVGGPASLPLQLEDGWRKIRARIVSAFKSPQNANGSYLNEVLPEEGLCCVGGGLGAWIPHGRISVDGRQPEGGQQAESTLLRTLHSQGGGAGRPGGSTRPEAAEVLSM